MRYLQLVTGIVLVIKGVHECVVLPAAIAALRVGSAYSAGEATGLAIGALAVLVGGVTLVLHGWRAKRTVAAGPAGA
jgi:hypothetical protein